MVPREQAHLYRTGSLLKLMVMEPNSDYSASQHFGDALIDMHALIDGVTWLIFRSDWYLLYAIPKQVARLIPTLFGVGCQEA